MYIYTYLFIGFTGFIEEIYETYMVQGSKYICNSIYTIYKRSSAGGG